LPQRQNTEWKGHQNDLYRSRGPHRHILHDLPSR